MHVNIWCVEIIDVKEDFKKEDYEILVILI